MLVKITQAFMMHFLCIFKTHIKHFLRILETKTLSYDVIKHF
jgi:hypothetical protein